MKTKSNRGGAREGAGRPKGAPRWQLIVSQDRAEWLAVYAEQESITLREAADRAVDMLLKKAR